MSAPWYARYPGDYGRDTAHLSMIEHGAYTLLLDHYYSTAEPLPADAAALYRICRAFRGPERKAVDSILEQFFSRQADGRYRNARADVELVKQAGIREKLSKSGRRGAEKRWGKDGPAIGQAIANPHPHPQPHKEKRKNAAAPPPDPRHKLFSEFAYQAFQKKYLQAPTWGAKHYEGLRLFLAKFPHIAQDEWERRYLFFLASTDSFYQQKRGSLVYFAANFDEFIAGPIHEKPKGGTHGKPSSRVENLFGVAESLDGPLPS